VPEDGTDFGNGGCSFGRGDDGDDGAGFAAGGCGLVLGLPQEKTKLTMNKTNKIQ